MAANEDPDISCIFDPNFAIICSFFEKFSSLCGIKQHTHKELQEIIDFVEEIPPELIDLHIRLMRKARKNVNPERWQRTLAKFCYFTLPDDCWELEQRGYKQLNRSQRLRILVALIGAQFDYNVKFKTDINKLGIDDLRLTPFGKDKNGNNYWLHTDEDLNLKIYKEDLDDEKWELVAKNRDELEKLIEELMKERDPNRKLDEIENEVEEEELEKQSDYEEEPEPKEEPQLKELEPENEPLPEPQPATEKTIDTEITTSVKEEPVLNPVPLVEPSQLKPESSQLTQKPVEFVNTESPNQSDENESKEVPKMDKNQESTPTTKPFNLKKRNEVADCIAPVRLLNKESFAQHLKTLNSHDVMRPLLFNNNIKVASNASDSLKTKINQKFKAIKPTMSNTRDLLLVKPSKPGLKLEQILKSKLAQKLAANLPASSETKEVMTVPAVAPASSAGDTVSNVPPSGNPELAVETTSSALVTNAVSLKRKLSSEETSSEMKKIKPSETDDEEQEIEEPVMLVTGVGSGEACEMRNETDNEKKTESAPSSNATTNQLTHKVDDILKKDESENGDSASTSIETSYPPAAKSDTELAVEKKKPKLWTIDAICSSDTKEMKCSDDVSSFPNYSFNRDSKKTENSLFRGCGSSESYSIFNLAADSKEDLSMSMPTNFYFGCNNQNPCFLPTEHSPVNNYKPPNKTHNVKDFVDNLEVKESSPIGVGEVPNFNIQSLCSKATSTIANDIPVKECVDIKRCCGQTSGDEAGKALNLSSESVVFHKSEEATRHSVVDVNPVAESTPHDDISQVSKTKAPEKTTLGVSEPAIGSSHIENEFAEETYSASELESTYKKSPMIELQIADPSRSILKEPKPAIETTSTAAFKPVDEVSRVMESTFMDVTNQKVELQPEGKSQGSSSTSEFKIEQELERMAVGEPNKTVQTEVGKCISKEPLAVAPQTEAVNADTNEKTDINDVNIKFDAVKLSHLVPSEMEKPAPSEVLGESTHQRDQALSPTIKTEVEETNSADGPGSNKERTLSLAPQISSPIDSPIQDSSAECIAEQNSKQIVKKQSISNESLLKPVQEVEVQSSSVSSAIETTEKVIEESIKEFSTETVQQSVKLKQEVLEETDVRYDPQSTDEKLTAQETTVVELNASDEPKGESKGVVPHPKDAEDPKKMRKGNYVEPLATAVRPSRQTRSSRTMPADDIVYPLAIDVPAKTSSKDEFETKVEGSETAPPTRGGNRRSKQPKETKNTTPKGITDTKPARRGGRRKKSIVDEQKLAGLDDVENVPIDKTENSEKNKSATETAEKEVEVEESEANKNTRLDPPIESTNEDESIGSAKGKIQKEDASESKLATSRSQESASRIHDEAVEEQQQPADANLNRGKSEGTDSDYLKPATSGSQPATSNDNDSKDSVVSQPTPGKRKIRRTEATRLLEENGQNIDESMESSPTKRTTRRSQVCADAEEDPIKGRAVKGGQSKSVTPVVESKRSGRRSQLVVPEKGTAKEPAGKKGKGKASLEEPKRVEASTKTHPETGDKETPSTNQPSTSKKKGGRGKKLSKEKVDDVENDDEKEVKPEVKSNDENDEAQNEGTLNGNDKNEDNGEKSEKATPKKRVTKRGLVNEVDVKNIEKPNSDGSPGIRQSRRIAQLKIKEQAEVKYVEPTTPKKTATNQKSKPVSSVKKNSKSPNKKNKNKSNRDESEDEVHEKLNVSPKKKKKKNEPKKKFDITKAWKASSDSSSEEEDAEEDDHFEEDEEEIVINDASDHEFSPESDIDDDDYIPVKRARTAHSKPSAEDIVKRDDLSCQHCGTADQPEWILLCDACDEGWHASCLKPPILSIPEGDWFCPPCQHNKLITSLQKFLISYDKNLKKKANEELRKKRLEYVDISFSNIIIDSQSSHQLGAKAKRAESESSGSADESSDDDESEGEEEEPLYQLRVRRQVNVSHRLNEYEELMNSAIQREDNIQIIDTRPVPQLKVGETLTMQNGDECFPLEEEVAEPGDDNEIKDDDEEDFDENAVEEKKVAPVILNLRNIRKKPPRLTKLDVSSEDDRYSDEDFKGSSADDRDEDDDYGKSESDSDEAQYRSGRHGPVRRSTRARVSRYDNDFIDDDSDDDEDEEYGSKKKKKKKRKRYSESDSEEDSTWGKRKKNKYARPSKSSRSSQKKRKRIRFEGDSDEDRKKSVKSRIKYGLDEREDEHPQRRTRGKKINYLENLGSDSEEDDLTRKKKSRKILSDDDEYVEEDDENEQNANLETFKSDSEEDDASSKNDSNSIPENPETDNPCEPLSTTDSTKAVSPTQPSVEPKAILEMTRTSPETNEAGSLKKKEKTVEVHEKIPVAEEAATKPSMPIESAKIVNQITVAPMQQSYSDIIQEDPKTAPTIVEANSSLKCMQSMTQSLPQVTAAATAAVYATPSVIDPKYSPISTSSGPVSVNFTDVGIRYEELDGEKFAPPLRVVSPSKLYGMQEQKRAPVPPQFTAPPHIQPPMPGPPPNRMMIPHSMPNAVQLSGPLPMVSSPQMHHPLPKSLQSPQQSMSLPPNMPTPKSKPPRKSRSKKQQEQERLEREAVEAASRGGDEMIPLHMLKGPVPPPSEMNMTRPPLQSQIPPFSTASAPPFMPYPNVQPQMRFPQQLPVPSSSAATLATVPAPGNTSKRVKITPTRMRMGSPQNMMRFQRAPGTAPMYRSPEMPTSGTNPVPSNDKVPMPPPSSNAPTVTTSPAKSEPMSVAPPTMKPDQYYLPMSTYPPSQMPRGQHRPEFTYVRNPMPPSPYRQPVSGAPPPLTVTSIYSRMSHPYSMPPTTISGSAPQPRPPIAAPPSLNLSSPTKPDVAAKVPPSTVPQSTPPAPPISYASPYLSTPPGTPTTSSPKMTQPAHSLPQGPLPPTSTSPYQILHVKQIPLTVEATMQSSTAPNLIYPPPSLYYTSPMMPNSYGQQPPQLPPAQLPPGLQQPSLSPYSSALPTSAPSTQAPPTSTTVGVRSASLPPSSMPYPPPPTSSAADLPPTSLQSVEYAAPTSQVGEFHYPAEPGPVPPPTSVSSAPTPSASAEIENSAYSQQASTYDKEAEEEHQQSTEQQQPQTPTEESSGEFGGLVSYFSSQREDDLDS